jgi:exoribonuclease-2
VDDDLTADLDDGLSVEPDGGDGVRIGIHVADPAALIARDSLVDREAATRGTSHYLPELRIPMLPKVLSEGACSLLPGETRPALSFLCRVGFDGTLREARLALSRIRSRGRFSYEAVDALLLNEPAAGGASSGPAGEFLAPHVALLARAAAGLEARRREQGATPIAAPDVEARPRADGTLELVRAEADRPGRALIAEMMVLAGRAAAEMAIAAGVPVLFRRQSPPDEPVVVPPLHPYDPVAVRRARRAMRRGEVGPQPGAHAALGLPAYAQATSPLRRYQDFVTHRQLRAIVLKTPPPYDLESLQRIAATYEEQERESRMTERASRDYWLLRWIEDAKRRAAPAPLRVRGAVTGIEGRGRTDIELCETLYVSSVPRRPGHAPGQVLDLIVEKVNPRAGTILLREP